MLRRVVRAPSASVIAATLALVLAIGVLRPTYLRTNQILDVLQASTYVGLLAAGMAFLISMREIDLSVGSTFGLCLIATAILISEGYSTWVAAVAGILLGGLLGGVNAAIVTWVR
ncbi:MAG: ABC transporter permease subunit, partial [Stackebrandtia sp.]